LEETVTGDVNVDPKWHKNFIAYRAKLINKISSENCNVRISFPKTADSNVVTLKGPKEAVESAKKQILEYTYKFENQVTLEVAVPQKYHQYIIGSKGVNSQKICDDFKIEIKFPAKSEPTTNGHHHHNNNNNPQQTTNGAENGEYENGEAASLSSPSKSDIIEIKGLKEDCEKAREAILELVPKTEEYSFPKNFHKELIANSFAILNNINRLFSVQVKVPQKGDDSEFIKLEGTLENIDRAKKSLEATLEELELKNFTVEITNINAKHIPQLRGRLGVEAQKLEKKFSVKVDFSKQGQPDKVTIRGIQKNVLECKAHIEQRIQEEESKVIQEIQIDNKVKSRIIGFQGKALAKIQEKFKVDIDISSRQSDTVIVKGNTQEQVDDACDHLKNLEEEFLQDVIDKEAYTHPSRQSSNNDEKMNGPSKGFVVRGAPWEAPSNTNGGGAARGGQPLNPDEPAPDTSNMEDFPTITAAVTGPGSAQKSSWGPSRK